MRFFIIKNNAGEVVEKQAAGGDSVKISAQLETFRQEHPKLTVVEVDEITFNATVVPKPPTTEQAAWAAFKATSPTPAQAIVYLAKFLGLE